MKFAKPLCERGAAGGADGGGHAPLWMRLLSARSSPESSPEQRLRPYSSPDRGLSDVVGPAPDERLLAAACYSLQPPALPMWLVAAPLPPLATLSPSPTPSPHAALISAPFDEERCKNAVRSVLYELSALLPLCPTNPVRPTSARCPRSPHSAVAFYADTEHRKISLLDDKARIVDTSASTASKGAACSAGSVGSTGSERSAGSLRNARHYDDMRHVATQAHDPRNLRRGDCYPDEWLGGVRALRDSYVRLVLRQLRHIERLNRALDQFTGATAARAPRAPRLHRTLRTCSLTRSR